MNGERGDTGQRGVAGERGPKGDHGQPGDIGPEGPAGAVTHDEERERKRDRKALFQAAQLLAVPVSIVTLAAVVGMGVFIARAVEGKVEERERTIYVVCIESQKNRDAVRTILQDAARRTATSKQRTPEEKADAAEFYGRAIARLKNVPCDPPPR